ncbi:MAG: SDR family NAD(P)-dependent oxidoreductase [Verrucomicrobia bacterium]|nr:SDR family NAD(P)-dependent oxidoreductase [Verrucomicrobiota bacterium]MDA1087262.1 SDR family NAD(P)-dependent oxidoreductase [Verrucomicrobiota bacterium]
MSLPRAEIRDVLVTGCSSGIGYATARMLREHGWSVHPTVRRDEDLERLRAEGFNPLILHVDDAESVERRTT